MHPASSCTFTRGSPPRMRGKPLPQTTRLSVARITPADAGKTPSCDGRPPEYEDHPRGCGENLCFQLSAATTAGSPPRMRGKHALPRADRLPCRITPADAGKTPRIALIGQLLTDHPRGCGENQVDILDGAGDNRITPADAGKTWRTRTKMSTTPDHPRGCGENELPGLDLDGFDGSPPRMRGKHSC